MSKFYDEEIEFQKDQKYMLRVAQQINWWDLNPTYNRWNLSIAKYMSLKDRETDLVL